MRISDWSSDVCSSDLLEAAREAYEALVALSRMPGNGPGAAGRVADAAFNLITDLCESDGLSAAQIIYDELTGLSVANDHDPAIRLEIGRASCRERVCQYV